MKTAVIYARYSCDNQNEASIEGQLRVCNEYAKSHNIKVVDNYIDRAISGRTENRAEFQRMIKDSAKKQWDCVLVYKLDRFSRDKYATAIYKKALRDNGVKLISAMENIPDSPEGIILESVLEGLNQYYSMELAQKVARGMKELRIKGKWGGGRIAYGYKVNNEQKIEIVEEEAEIIKEIYKMYLNGSLTREILDYLNSRKLLIHGKPFDYNHIYRILKNNKYTGSYICNGEKVDNVYPKIISLDIYNKTQVILDINNHGACRRDEDAPIFKGKIFCGICGSKMLTDVGHSKTGKIFYYYKCKKRKNDKKACPNHSIRQDILEKYVLKTIVNQLKKPEIKNYIIKRLLKIQEENIQTTATMKALLKQQADINSAIKNLLNLLEKGISSDITSERLQELDIQRKDLQQAIKNEEKNQTVTLTEREMVEFFEKGIKLERFALINYFIEKIIVYENEIAIYFYSPIEKSPDGSQDFLFYRRVVEDNYFAHRNKFAENTTTIKFKI